MQQKISKYSFTLLLYVATSVRVVPQEETAICHYFVKYSPIFTGRQRSCKPCTSYRRKPYVCLSHAGTDMSENEIFTDG